MTNTESKRVEEILSQLSDDAKVLRNSIATIVVADKKLGVETSIQQLKSKTPREISAYAQEQELKKGTYLVNGSEGFLTPEGEFVVATAEEMFDRERTFDPVNKTLLAERLGFEYDSLEAEIAMDQQHEIDKTGEPEEHDESLEGIDEYYRNRAEKNATGVLIDAGYAKVTINKKGQTVVAKPDVEAKAVARIEYLRELSRYREANRDR